MSELRATVTGATGLVGARVVEALRGRGAHVTVLSRDPGRARSRLGDVEAMRVGAGARAGAPGGARRSRLPLQSRRRADRAALEHRRASARSATAA